MAAFPVVDIGKSLGSRSTSLLGGHDLYESKGRVIKNIGCLCVNVIDIFKQRGIIMPEGNWELQEVFVLSGVPSLTFVQSTEYSRLLVALKTAGRSIIIEGPSGIGKTSAVVKAIQEAGIDDKVISLSARKPDDIAIISDLGNQVPFGTVIIDDFHRLTEPIKKLIADLMKTLADEASAHSKLVVIGITNAGQSLISFGHDLTNRVEIIPFESNPESKVQELLEKGERALGVSINVREEIVREAQGSFYLAQMLAYNTCLRAGKLKQSSALAETKESFETTRSLVMATLSRAFHQTAIAFARGSKLRREGRAPYLHLLYWLAQSNSWHINTDRETDHHPEQRGSVSQVVSKGYLKELIDSSADIQRVIYFEANGNLLVIQDPQFVFYIRNLSWPRFAEEVGYISLDFPSRYDFALSFAGADRAIAESLSNELQEREFEVFYDKNEQHRILAADVEEYLAPIYSSDAQLVVCILGSDYPSRIWTKFESDQFKDRFKSGNVVPVVLASAPLGIFDSATKVGHFSWDPSKDMNAQTVALAEILTTKCGEIRRAHRAKVEEAAKDYGLDLDFTEGAKS